MPNYPDPQCAYEERIHEQPDRQSAGMAMSMPVTAFPVATTDAEDQLSSAEFRQKLYKRLKSLGIVGKIKSQLRCQLVSVLRSPTPTGILHPVPGIEEIPALAPATASSTSAGQLGAPNPPVSSLMHPQPSKTLGSSLVLSVANQLIAGYLKFRQYEFTLSVFQPECELPDTLLENSDILRALSVDNSCVFKRAFESTAPAQATLLRILHALRSFEDVQTSDRGIQTTSSATQDLLGHKLRSVDDDYTRRVETEKFNSALSAEERMFKFQKEADERARQEAKLQYQQWTETDLARVRLEEKSKYKMDLAQARIQFEKREAEMTQKFRDREEETRERFAKKEQELEHEQYQQRQRLLMEIERVNNLELKLHREAKLNAQALRVEEERVNQVLEKAKLKTHEAEKMRTEYEQRFRDDLERFKDKFVKDHAEQTAQLQSARAQFQIDRAVLDDRMKYFEELKEKFIAVQKELDFTKEALRKAEVDLEIQRRERWSAHAGSRDPDGHPHLSEPKATFEKSQLLLKLEMEATKNEELSRKLGDETLRAKEVQREVADLRLLLHETQTALTSITSKPWGTGGAYASYAPLSEDSGPVSLPQEPVWKQRYYLDQTIAAHSAAKQAAMSIHPSRPVVSQCANASPSSSSSVPIPHKWQSSATAQYKEALKEVNDWTPTRSVPDRAAKSADSCKASAEISLLETEMSMAPPRSVEAADAYLAYLASKPLTSGDAGFRVTDAAKTRVDMRYPEFPEAEATETEMAPVSRDDRRGRASWTAMEDVPSVIPFYEQQRDDIGDRKMGRYSDATSDDVIVRTGDQSITSKDVSSDSAVTLSIGAVEHDNKERVHPVAQVTSHDHPDHDIGLSAVGSSSQPTENYPLPTTGETTHTTSVQDAPIPPKPTVHAAPKKYVPSFNEDVVTAPGLFASTSTTPTATPSASSWSSQSALHEADETGVIVGSNKAHHSNENDHEHEHKHENKHDHEQSHHPHDHHHKIDAPGEVVMDVVVDADTEVDDLSTSSRGTTSTLPGDRPWAALNFSTVEKNADAAVTKTTVPNPQASESSAPVKHQSSSNGSVHSNIGMGGVSSSSGHSASGIEFQRQQQQSIMADSLSSSLQTRGLVPDPVAKPFVVEEMDGEEDAIPTAVVQPMSPTEWGGITAVSHKTSGQQQQQQGNETPGDDTSHGSRRSMSVRVDKNLVTVPYSPDIDVMQTSETDFSIPIQDTDEDDEW